MKRILSLFLLCISQSVYSIPILADLDFTTPEVLNDITVVSADFGSFGSDINIESLELILTFEQNLLDSFEGFSLSYLDGDLLGVSEVSISLLPRSNLLFDLSDIYINDSGATSFSISAGGDGVNISSISLSGESVSVPEPTTFMLLLGSLTLLFGFSKLRT